MRAGNLCFRKPRSSSIKMEVGLEYDIRHKSLIAWRILPHYNDTSRTVD